MWIAWAVYFRTHRRDCFPRIACASIVLYVYVYVVFDFPLQVWIAIFEGEKLVSEGEGGVVTHTCMYTYIYMCVSCEEGSRGLDGADLVEGGSRELLRRSAHPSSRSNTPQHVNTVTWTESRGRERRHSVGASGASTRRRESGTPTGGTTPRGIAPLDAALETSSPPPCRGVYAAGIVAGVVFSSPSFPWPLGVPLPHKPPPPMCTQNPSHLKPRIWNRGTSDRPRSGDCCCLTVSFQRAGRWSCNWCGNPIDCGNRH